MSGGHGMGARPQLPLPVTSVGGIEWPAVVAGNGAMLLAFQHTLEASQWWPPERHLELQLQQLRLLLAHAYRTVPFYRPRLEAAGYRAGQEIDLEFWRRVPILGRRELGESVTDLVSAAIPAALGTRREESSSGSTGTPVTVVKTATDEFLWRAFTLREELWHRRDWSQTIAVIRMGLQEVAAAPDGARHENWGAPLATLYETGPSALLHIAAPIADQAAWLARVAPGYLLTHPSNLRALARHCRENRLVLPSLRQLRTVGEVVDPDLREECRETWGIEIVDMYSAAECGYIALQCPGHARYHVQSESLLLEVLGDDGAPCRPGERGRVVLTPLHSFAMPLLRYEIGDLAVLGEPCPCGRGLPVLAEVVGRVRDMLVLPSGVVRYPTGLYSRLTKIAGLMQYQLVQKSLDALEFRLAVRPPFSPADEAELRDVVAARLGAHFAVSFVYLDEILRAPSGKFFEFRCEVASS